MSQKVLLASLVFFNLHEKLIVFLEKQLINTFLFVYFIGVKNHKQEFENFKKFFKPFLRILYLLKLVVYLGNSELVFQDMLIIFENFANQILIVEMLVNIWGLLFEKLVDELIDPLGKVFLVLWMVFD